MIEFFTPVILPDTSLKSSYPAKHLMIGSCFTEYIGSRMESLKFNTDINPFGILFNPASIADGIKRLISGEPFPETDLFQHEGLWHSYRHHGRFSFPDRQEALTAINSRLAKSSEYLRKADFLILTFGTAWVYELKSSGVAVSNCHKVPASEFRRFRLTVHDIVTGMRDALEQLWDIHPGIRVILTVSPVRHLKDGAIGNQLSKATLLLAADALVNGFGTDCCSYFPAYELVMDELRDYRFYAEDMVHPSPFAIDLIWEKFCHWLFGKEVAELSERIHTLRQAFNHRPQHQNTPEFRKFAETQLQRLKEYSKTYPFLDFSTEINYFAAEL